MRTVLLSVILGLLLNGCYFTLKDNVDVVNGGPFPDYDLVAAEPEMLDALEAREELFQK